MSTKNRYFTDVQDAFNTAQLIIGDDKIIGEILEVKQHREFIQFVDKRTGKVLEGFDYKDMNAWTVTAFRHFFYLALWREVTRSLKEISLN